jgi:hypothetical protein
MVVLHGSTDREAIKKERVIGRHREEASLAK